MQGFVRACPFARTGWLLAQQSSTQFRVPYSGLRVTPYHCFIREFLYNFTIPFRIILVRIVLKEKFFLIFPAQIILIMRILLFEPENQLDMIKTNKTNYL